MSKAKVYAIIYDNDHIYVPIKAATSPYTTATAPPPLHYYLATMPNFFGGTRDIYEKTHPYNKTRERSDVEALKAEIDEESQGKFTLPAGFDAAHMEVLAIDSADYSFYKIAKMRVTGEPVFDEHGKCVLGAGGGFTQSQKEQQCILKIPKERITGATADKCVNALIEHCKTLGDDFCRNPESVEEFNNDKCHTRKAFLAFFRSWLDIAE